jgi:L-lysine exporter family protein LysE/ArgO
MALSFSLILAIGAQNAFVLRQGLLRQHVFAVAVFCSVSDAVLIGLGVSGVSWLLDDLIKKYSLWVFAAAAIWLMIYGLLHLRSAFKVSSLKIENIKEERSLLLVLITTALVTFGNPHVYLDTLILIGTISTRFSPEERLPFAIGAALASFTFFFSLAYGAKLLAPKFKNAKTWQALDISIAIIMFLLAFGMLGAGGWLKN